jgi:membrane-associated phospholipid phosphatase
MIDRSVLMWFVRHREPWLTTAVRIITTLGGSAVLIPLVLSIGAWYRWGRHRSRPLALLSGAYGGSFLLSQAVKALTDRARPPANLAIGHFGGHAFPSGHATEAAAVYGMLAVVVATGISCRRGRVAVWAGAVLLVTMIGITRLYLAAHWLTDVLAGWALGSAWVLAILAAQRRTLDGDSR